MKKLICLIVSVAFLVLSSALYAEGISQHTALKVAERFFASNDASSSASRLSLSIKDEAFYVFNREGGGFVVVSAHDAARPILGYSLENNLYPEDVSDNLLGWMNDVRDDIRYGINNGAGDPKTLALWRKAMTPTKGESALKPAVKHETAQWNQTPPFNGKSPVVDGEKSVTGCGPLSIAIIMKFYQWPEKGTGTIPGYSYTTDEGTTRSQEGITLGHPYSWDKMPLKFEEGKYTEEQADAVAQLIYECGVMTKASFDKSTAINLTAIAPAMNTYMGYDAGINYYYKGYFSDEKWEAMLKEELQEHPVIYRGRSSAVGHIFVIDGYDTEGNFSVNWGKGGNANGYFALSALIYNKTSYTTEQVAYFGIRPDNGGSPLRYLAITSGTYSGSQYQGIELVSGTLGVGEFSVKTGLRNCGNDVFNGQIVVAHTDSEGGVKEHVSDPVDFSNLKTHLWRGIPSISCKAAKEFEDGDKVIILYRYEGEDEWHPALANADDGVVGELVYKDDRSLAKSTSVVFNNKTHLLIVRTRAGASFKLTSSSGEDVYDGVSCSDGTLTVDSTKLNNSLYTLTVSKGSETYSVKIKMGGK